MYMGLHRAKQAPSLRSIGVHAGSPRSRAHTWLGCFLTSTALAKHVGVSAPIRGTAELATIEHFVRTYPLPPEFAYQIMVYHTLAKFFNTIVENSQESMSHSLIRIIDAELDGLKTRYPVPWTTRTEVTYLTAKLLLYTTVIIRLQSDRTTREILMRNGLSVAVRIAYLTNQGLAFHSTDFADLEMEQLRNTLPKNYYRALVLSIVFLIRFFVLNSQATPEEQELARNHVAIAQRYLKGKCKDPLDERVRGAILFDVLCRQKPVELETSKLKVDDRMAASLVYDAVSTGHVLRQMPVEVDESSPKASPNPSSADVPPPQKEQEQPALAPDVNAPDASLDLEGFGPMDFSLPEDLWGDSVWGMFDTIPAAGYSTYTQPGGEGGGMGSQYPWN
ncbi:hypothetical protein FB567DRAFT_549050 [Paraphoma chrysanthemicola]|uniref:Uncharacterized protein n=1 Tax=Paraphoma chrysanthemicola TaxID=798071 RepID=A0A8K0R972_9PLEO|nr:hypothetical protein FB567DRAFT_549050 [Paraphoma chrysanthemicola]